MRLLTRNDFDGLACAVLLVEKGVVDSFSFVHPKDVQDGKVEVTSNDVLANIPYAPGCGLWFDHHVSEQERIEIDRLEFKGACLPAESAAQVIWDYYGGQETFGDRYLEFMESVNKTDSANLTRSEILNPTRWILIYFLIDPRTGIGRFQDLRISHQQFVTEMIDHIRTKPIDEILGLPDVIERENRYFGHQEFFRIMLNRSSRMEGNVIITNLLNEAEIYCGNRFIVYALYPESNVEVRVMWGKRKENVVITCGQSVLNRTCKTNIGKLMLHYGGGGHAAVGTCQVAHEDWERVLEEIVATLRKENVS